VTRTDTTIVTEGVLAGTPRGTWTIDPAHTSVTFSVRHLMSKVRGQFGDLAGRVVIGETLESCSAEVSIQTVSVHTGMPMRDDDLRSANFFESERFPTMRFVSRGLREDGGEFALIGDLTIRDVTQPVTLAVEFLGVDHEGLAGEPRVGFSGRTTLRRSDFGVGETPVAGSRVVVGDTITVEIDLEAHLES
jgi:polyisoprenoid-binding protein YceI